MEEARRFRCEHVLEGGSIHTDGEGRVPSHLTQGLLYYRVPRHWKRAWQGANNPLLT
jgi:agmatine/peptidylarginine deiminase